MAEATGGTGRGPRTDQGAGGPRDATSDTADATGPAVSARTLPAPEPGPTITRAAPVPAGTRVRNKGNTIEQKRRARARVRASQADDTAPRGRSAAAQIQEAHADAASMFGLPELELRGDEAARVARAFERTQDMTGFTASGPFWDWLYIAYVVAGVYGRRILQILERRRAAAAAAPPPGAASPPPPPANFGGPLPAPIAPGPRTQTEQPAPVVPFDSTSRDTHPATGQGATVDIMSAQLAAGADNIVGFERRIPGLPISTIEERLGGL